jgi:hypothetical protein
VDRTYAGLTLITNILASALLLSNGVAAVTTSALRADTNYLGSHFITATYRGDGTFPAGSATLVQKVHAYATSASLVSAAAGSNNAVVVTATVACSPAGHGTPSGMVAFWDGASFRGQLPLTSNGVASLTITNFAVGTHSLSATYASDTLFASSTGLAQATPPTLSSFGVLTNGAFQLQFSNTIGAPFSVLSSPDVTQPLANWTVLGSATEFSPGQFRFIDSQAPLSNQQFYRVRSP